MATTLEFNGLRVASILFKNSQETEDLVTFTNEIVDGKLHLCAVLADMFSYFCIITGI